MIIPSSSAECAWLCSLVSASFSICPHRPLPSPFILHFSPVHSLRRPPPPATALHRPPPPPSPLPAASHRPSPSPTPSISISTFTSFLHLTNVMSEQHTSKGHDAGDFAAQNKRSREVISITCISVFLSRPHSLVAFPFLCPPSMRPEHRVCLVQLTPSLPGAARPVSLPCATCAQ